MLKIIADDAIPFLRGVFEPFAQVTYLPGAAIAGADLKDTDALIIRTRTKCNAKLLAGTGVRIIASATIGMDHVDAAGCEKLGIRCVNAPGCNSSSVAQYMVSVLMAESAETGGSLSGRTLGIVGAGHVGKKVAAAASALGMKVLLNDPPRARAEGPSGFVSLDRILAESDYITMHTPLNRDYPDRTYHLADEDFFLKAARTPFFINASRGPVTDQNALKSALITGRIRGAALDVWEDEPDIGQELLDMVRIATPHIAGYSADGKAAGTAMAVRAVAEFFGLGELADFRPEGVPAPDSPVLTVSTEHPVESAVFSAYDVRRDDAALRKDPGSFERLRAHYPVRREFPAYRIGNADRISGAARSVLRSLGFAGC